MIGIKVSLPIASFRKGMAREYLETHELPPPSTCYGFLLSLVGETDRLAHTGVRITAVVCGNPAISVVLRTVWRVKKTPLGSSGNTRPDYQQLMTNIELIIWLDSSGEILDKEKMSLEDRVRQAFDPERRGSIDRFSGLSLGESTHLINDISIYHRADDTEDNHSESAKIFLLDKEGTTTLPVWVDHVGGEKTRYVTGNIIFGGLTPPDPKFMPIIDWQ
ncbi:MAG: type I-MYXAN CRISPR-associated protein Cas5/Cmx5/DevS [Planctomycetia bacterium]|nr:type I-MYXAN CRISPR-associated protein Cas5/Cmx5/DevS [Planctomycetia bacterium]